MKRKFRKFLVERPSLYFLSYWLRHFKFHQNIVNKNTDIVIEAPARSANTFLVQGIKYLNPKIKVADHLHLPVQIIYGVQNNIPAVTILREPILCCISWKIFLDDDTGVDYYFERYIDFFKPLKKYKNKILWLTFEEVTKDQTNVINKINDFFALELNNFTIDNPFDKDVIFKNIENLYTKMDGKILENRVSIPSKKRDNLKQELLKEVNSEDYQYKDLIKEAIEIYNYFKNG